MKMLKRILSIAICVMMLTSVAFASNTSVIEYTSTTEDGVTTVTATALATSVGEKAVSLYTAVYNADGSFVGAKKSNTTDSNLLKNTVTISDGQTVKSFIWEGSENTPVKMPATSGKVFTAEDVEITFDGVAVFTSKPFTAALLVIEAATILLLVFCTYSTPYKTIFRHN